MGLAQEIQQLADKCVRCGLCLPHCPTYAQNEHEGESPRGRIALWQGLASGQLPLTATAQEYLDHCLACGACEAVCPAEVAYDKLLIAGRAWQAQANPPLSWRRRWRKKALAILVRFPYLLRIATKLLPFWIPHLLPRRAVYTTPPAQLRARSASTSPPVLLAPGCIHPILDPQTLIDSRLLLQACGYRVIVPRMRCCGAWSAHQGESAAAETCRQHNQTFLQRYPDIPVLSTATGCAQDWQKATPRAQDILAFLHYTSALAPLTFAPLAKKALLHIPCTQRNGLKQAALPELLLRHIPDLTLVSPASPHCCGGAGSYFMEFAQQAQDLARHLLQTAQQQKVDMVISSNIGCALHLQQQLRRAGIGIAVWHPVSVLARQISE